MPADPIEEDPRTADEMLDRLRTHAEWTDRERDEYLGRLVERFPAEEVVEAVGKRLGDLGGNDADALVRLVEANPTLRLIERLGQALVLQKELPPERVWNALALLEDLGRLDNFPTLAERWQELNEALDEEDSMEQLLEQIEEDPQGVWLALQGLGAVEPEVRPLIVGGLRGRRLGHRTVEFLRQLAYAHDFGTRAVALEVLASETADADPDALLAAWTDLATHHPDPAVTEQARVRLTFGDVAPITPVARLTNADHTPNHRSEIGGHSRLPCLEHSLVTTIDGHGRGAILLGARRGFETITVLFECDVERGIVAVSGDVVSNPFTSASRAPFEELSELIERQAVEDKNELAVDLLKGSLLVCTPSAPPSLRFWIEATLGPGVIPCPLRAESLGSFAAADSPREMAELAEVVLNACPDWLDTSPLTYELAEEIRLREGAATPDPRRDAGAYRFLFEHRLRGELERYRRMLLWMAWYWQSAGDVDLARSALTLSWQLSDAQNVVPGHPFTLALTTRSLAAAVADPKRGIAPKKASRHLPELDFLRSDD
jgi:hypothetical protein